METKPDRAILFLNLGGPETLSDVKSFLYELFVDPEILRVPFTPFRKLIAKVLSITREKTSQEMYKKIGGGSPIRRLTDHQSSGVESLLNKEGFKVLVRTAFTCSPPFVEDVIRDLQQKGIKKLLAFPLYPQYSLTTTKGSLDRVRSAQNRFAPDMEIFEVFSWPDHPLFLKAHVELIRQEAAQFSDPNDKSIHLLFSAHSIPEKLVTQLNDPYKDQMEKTVQGVLEGANWKGPWSLAWQSKLGPVKWIEPATIDVIRDLGSMGVKQILIVPIAFVTDHVETLFEIDQLFREKAHQAGIGEFRRTRSLNDHPTFLAALSDLAKAQTKFWSKNGSRI